ncbi:immunoglobulin-like domain-containing protein [Pseudomonadota bacterium]
MSGAVDTGDFDGDGNLDLVITGQLPIGSSLQHATRIYRNQRFAENTAANVPDVAFGAGDWGDFDSDGDLDLLVAGMNSGSNYAGVLRNDSGVFTDIGATITGGFYSEMKWGDYDNDGDLDFAISGDGDSGYYLEIYRNNNGSFTDIVAGLSGLSGGSLDWGDYDNDGDLDLLAAGFNGTHTSTIYRNDNGTFTDIGAGLVGATTGSATWGDYDNDGDLDILLAGTTGSGTGTTKIYRNDAGTFSEFQTLASLTSTSASWADYDSDGDLDVALTGRDESTNIPEFHLYKYDNGSFVEVSTNLTALRYGQLDWGDFDNDGAIDLVLTGSDSGSDKKTLVFRNLGSDTFAEITGLGLANTGDYGSLEWGDYDNDGDLDLLAIGNFEGEGYRTKLYENGTQRTNSAPSAPDNLATSVNDSAITFSWDAAADNETASTGLTYNLRVGTTPGGNEIMSAMSASNGSRLIAASGNVGHNTSWTIDGIADQVYWSVQAMDNSFVGSAFAEEQTDSSLGAVFTVTPSAGLYGGMSPSTAQSVNRDGSQVFTIYPHSGRHVVTPVGGTCGGTYTGDVYSSITFTTHAVNADCTVEPTFATNIYTVSGSIGANGSTNLSLPVDLPHNTNRTWRIIPNTGYHVDTVGGTCNGTTGGDAYNTTNGIYYVATVLQDCTIEATFAINTYNITPFAGDDGFITPNVVVNTPHGTTNTYTITPAVGFHVVTPVGGTCGGSYIDDPYDSSDGISYTTNPVFSDCTVAPSYAMNDTDGDGRGDIVDNCPSNANANQLDTDSDGTGDVCDATPNGDDDNDGIDNTTDNCPAITNADQLNTDGDSQGDACDSDDDNDGVSDSDELLDGSDPLNPNDFVDRVAPVVTAPQDITVAATDASGTPVLNSNIALFLNLATATDNVDGVITTISHDAPSLFPLGDTMVTFTATDNNGNVGSAMATVSVTDQDGPAISLTGGSSMTVNYGEIYNEPGVTVIDNVDGDVSSNVMISGSVDTDAVGIYTLYYDVSDAAGNAADTAIRTVTVQDASAPVVNAPNSITVAAVDDQGVPATEAAIVVFLNSATASDDRDGTLTVETYDAPETFPLGATTVTFYATDLAGNSGSAQSVVTVVDQTAPVISLNGEASITLAVGDTYIKPSATASDNVDGDISHMMTTGGYVDNTTVGLYNLTYDVADMAGNNATTVVRQVVVQDAMAPVVTPPHAIEVAAIDVNGTDESDAGIATFLGSAVALDAVDGNINDVYNDAPAQFPLGVTVVTFTATDSSGNTGVAQSSVIVSDKTAPVMTLNGASTLTMQVGDSYIEEGVTVTDNVDGDISGSATVTGSVDSSLPGVYVLQYTVSDAAGNESALTRTVTVQDSSAPVVTAPENRVVEATEESGIPATDLSIYDFLNSATAEDAVDGVVYSITNDAPAMFAIGETIVTFSATDSAGNVGFAHATVTVVEYSSPENEDNGSAGEEDSGEKVETDSEASGNGGGGSFSLNALLILVLLMLRGLGSRNTARGMFTKKD